MIEISKQFAFILYLGFSLGVVLLLWLLSEAKRKRRFFFEHKEETFTCPECGCVYTYFAESAVAECPICKEEKVSS